MTNSNLVSVFNGQIANQSTQLCNARDLHIFLEVNMRFAEWISNRITEYGFIENEDYIIVTERTAGRPRKEYHITLDMGKELGMVERNEKGRQIRQYFIKLEKQQKITQIAPLVEPEPTYTAELTEYEIEQLAWLCFSHRQMNDLIGLLIEPLEALGSRYGGIAYSHHHEYKRHYTESLATIKRLIEPFGNSKQLSWKRVIPRLTNN